MAITFILNGKAISADDDQADMPLLWYIREDAGLKGTKFGCGIGQCGACTVHLNGEAMRSCSLPLSQAQGTIITTIEGLAANSDKLHPVQLAWMDIDVPQCGYCQSGQIMAAAAMLSKIPVPSDEDIDQQMNNICRCGTYVRIRKAIKQAAQIQLRLIE
jgi:isoquinoline 1-oxidoreductase alpha subunit